MSKNDIQPHTNTQLEAQSPPVTSIVNATPSASIKPAVTAATIKNGKQIWVNISEVRAKGKKTSLVIDYLEKNPCWTPGGPPKPGCPYNNSDYFLNKVEERVEVPLSPNTKVYKCLINYGSYADVGPDNDPTNADTEISIDRFLIDLKPLQEPVDYYIDIDNQEIKSIYERCLP